MYKGTLTQDQGGIGNNLVQTMATFFGSMPRFRPTESEVEQKAQKVTPIAALKTTFLPLHVPAARERKESIRGNRGVG